MALALGKLYYSTFTCQKLDGVSSSKSDIIVFQVHSASMLSFFNVYGKSVYLSYFRLNDGDRHTVAL